jgi:hypothetical protein
MIRALARPRLTRLQLVIVAALSATATVLIIVAATGTTAAQSAALAALRHGQVLMSATGGSAAGSDAQLTPGVTPSAVPGSSSGQAGTGSGSSGSMDSGAAVTTTLDTTTTPSGPTGPSTKASPVNHVFVIALSTTSYDAAFGPTSAARYLNRTLKSEGTLLGGYESLGGGALPDYLAMISGQPPNADTRAGCPTYSDFAADAKPAADGTVPGDGCVYPNTALTIGDQMTSAGHQWRAYIDDLGPTACPHPDSGAVDDAPPRGAGVSYAGRHNPFIYFHSLLDLGSCASDDVSLTRLTHDLASSSATPEFAYIAPNACADAGAGSCPGGGATGLAAEDAFLRQWVPRITASKAYKDGGALLITFAPPGSTPGTAPNPDSPIPTGALVLSHVTPRNQIVSAVYNPYSVLRTTEDLLGLKPLGLAAKARSFVSKAFSGS